MAIPEVGTQNRYITLAVCGLLVLAIALVFGQTVRYDFVRIDDDRCVYANPHVTSGWTVPGMLWALTSRQGGAGWVPLTWFSHMAVWQCYGSNAGAHHLANVLLHAAAAVVLFLVLRSMTGRLWPSALVAALFAIHPLRVESVAWVTERKDVLSGLFFMLTLGAYANYVRHPFSFVRYAGVMVFFALGIMSKPMLVTVPAVLLLLDFWPLGRMRTGRNGPLALDPSEVFSRWAPAKEWIVRQSRLVGLVLEKLPLLALVALSCAQAVWYEAEAETVLPEDHVPIAWRVGNGWVSYVAYLEQTVCPVQLTLLYPHPGVNLPIGKIIGAALLLACISIGALTLWRRCPYLLVGWLWYLGMLVPTNGIVEFGRGVQAMADRFTYLPQIGLYVAFTWAVADVCRSWAWRRWMCGGMAALALAILMGCAWRQTTFWQDGETLYDRILTCFPRHVVVHRLLGQLLSDQGRTEEAVQHYRRACEIKPDSGEANYDLATALVGQGRLDEAVSYFRKALEIHPNYKAMHGGLGLALAMQGRLDEALAHYQRSLEIDPNDALVHEGVGSILMARGQFDEALPHCQRALEIQPGLAISQNNLGYILARRGQLDEALTHYQRALEIQPKFAMAHTNTGDVLAARGQCREALGHYRKALEIQPNDPVVQRSLAWLLATCSDASLRNGAEAVQLAQRANQLSGGKQPEVLDTLAAAYASAGWFPEALATARKALALARQQNNRVLADALQDRITLYEAGRPYHQTPTVPLSSP
jgi:Tfp pilus assembly protein PilF